MRTESKLALLGILLVFLFSCNTQRKGQSNLTVKFSKTVDSLLHDTSAINFIVDSLKKEELNASSDTEAINILNDLAQYYDKFGLKFAGDALKQSKQIDYQYGIVDAICRKGIYFFKRDKLDSANAYFEKGLALAKKHKEPK